ncbi:MAG: hypothetical protein OXP69_16995 [Spirochaetaceae bacterium]|nr:hypothetical protein [Spirochaetaceae bacterium]
MADPMTLKDEDVGRIGEYVKPWLREIVEETVPRVQPGGLGGVGGQLLERLIRVEEELKAQRMLMDERFKFMAQRFETVDKRFEDMNARFTTLTWMIGVGFVVITSLTTVFALLA